MTSPSEPVPGWPPPWVQASDEDRERWERFRSSRKTLTQAAQAAAVRCRSVSDYSAWSSRVEAALRDMDEWAGRFARMAPKPEEPADA